MEATQDDRYLEVGRILHGRRRPLAWEAPTMGVNNPVAEVIGVYEKYGIADIAVIPEWRGSVLTARIFGRKVPTRAAEEACR